MDPNTEAQVPASMDAVIPDTPPKKLQKMWPAKHQSQPSAALKVTLRSGQPCPDYVPNPDDDAYYEAAFRDSHHAAAAAATGGPVARDPDHNAGGEGDAGEPDHPLPPAAELHHQVHR